MTFYNNPLIHLSLPPTWNFYTMFTMTPSFSTWIIKHTTGFCCSFAARQKTSILDWSGSEIARRLLSLLGLLGTFLEPDKDLLDLIWIFNPIIGLKVKAI